MTEKQEKLAEEIIKHTQNNSNHWFHLGSYLTRRNSDNKRDLDVFLAKVILDELYVLGLMTKKDEAYNSQLTVNGEQFKSFRRLKVKVWFEKRKNGLSGKILLWILGILGALLAAYLIKYFGLK